LTPTRRQMRHGSPPQPRCCVLRCRTGSRLTAPLLAPPMLPADRRSRAPRVEHEKNTFFSSLENTRSGGGSQGRAFCARRVSERSPLTDDVAEGTPATDAQGRFPLFSTGSPAVTSGCSTATLKTRFLLVAFFATGSRTVTQGYCTAPILGWRVHINPMRSMESFSGRLAN